MSIFGGGRDAVNLLLAFYLSKDTAPHFTADAESCTVVIAVQYFTINVAFGDREGVPMVKRQIHPVHQDYFTDPAATRRYVEEAAGGQMKYQTFYELVDKLRPGPRWLDVGAGPGVVAAHLATRYPEAEITALDVAKPMVEAGRALIQSKGLSERIIYKQGDAADAALIAGLGKFDFIYSTFTLHHWPDAACVFEILMNALKSGGVMLHYDLRRAGWLARLPGKGGFLTSVRTAFRREELAGVLMKMGLPQARVTYHFPFLLAVIVHK